MRTPRRKFLKAAAAGAAGMAAGAFGVPHILRRTRGENIILIIADAMRADVVGKVVNGREVTPNINRLAAGGLYFTNAYSAAPATKFSMASIMTGLYPPAHGVEFPMFTLPSCISIPRFLKGRAYYTIGVVANPYMEAELGPDGSHKPCGFGFNEGFHIYHMAVPDSTKSDSEEPMFEAFARAPEVTKTFFRALDRIKVISKRTPQALFVYLHYMDTHQPWIRSSPVPGVTGQFHTTTRDPEAAYERDRALIKKLLFREGPKEEIVASLSADERLDLGALYLEASNYFDSCLAKLFEELRARDLFEGSTIILTSDHGDELAEHGTIGHGKNLFNTVLHVPLIIAMSGIDGRLIAGRVSNAMILPTLMALRGSTHRCQASYSLFDQFQSGADLNQEIFASIYRWDKIILADGKTAIKQGDLIGSFDLNLDPHETRTAPTSTKALMAMRKIRQYSEAYGRANGIERRYSTYTWQNPYADLQNQAAEEAIAERGISRAQASRLKSLGHFLPENVHQQADGLVNDSTLSPQKKAQLRALGYLQ